MTEDFLHYLWKFQNYDHSSLTTTTGERLLVIKPGFHNFNSGPDFPEAIIEIGDHTWAGSIEIHIRSSDWIRHRHQLDEAYNSVILHVVYEHDKEVCDANGRKLPVLELKGRFDEYPYWRFEQLVQSATVIPCSNQLHLIPSSVSELMLARAASERLEEKTALVRECQQWNKNNWIETSFQILAYGLGLKVNAHNMLQLVRRIPLKTLIREGHDLANLLSLLLGLSGLLSSQDQYTNELNNRFEHLSRKYRLKPMSRALWKYSRLRPASFPERRIAQLAHLLHANPDLPRTVLDARDINELRSNFLVIGPTEYWQHHFRLGVHSGRTKVPGLEISDGTLNNLLINAILPLRFLWNRYHDKYEDSLAGLDLLDQMPAESNQITRVYRELGFKVKSAADSQGVIQLNKAYCTPKKCLNCAIGIKILRPG